MAPQVIGENNNMRTIHAPRTSLYIALTRFQKSSQTRIYAGDMGRKHAGSLVQSIIIHYAKVLELLLPWLCLPSFKVVWEPYF